MNPSGRINGSVRGAATDVAPAAAAPGRAAWLQAWSTRWQACAPRERLALALGGSALALLVVWMVLLQPALRTLREAPAQLDAVDVQLQTMRALAAESAALRGATPVTTAQAAAALQSATEGLGDKAKLSVQGDRAVLTVQGLETESLRNWLDLARSAARARPVEAQLSRSAGGYSGTLVVSFGGGP